MKKHACILGIFFLLSALLISIPHSATPTELFAEELEWTIGDTWNYKVTFQSGRDLRLSHEIIDEGYQRIDGVSYEVFILNISGIIADIGNTMPLNMKIVPGTSSITGVMYHAKDDTAQKTIMNMTAHLRGDPNDTLYSYSVNEERCEYLSEGIPPPIIDVGTVWNITRIEKVNRSTIISGGHYGNGYLYTNNTHRQIHLTNLCVEKKIQPVAAGNFSVYKIRRTDKDTPGNYSLYFLSPLIKREILLLDFLAGEPFIPHQTTELLKGYNVSSAPTSLTALFTWNPQNPGINETVTLTANRSSDPQANITSYSWSYTSHDAPHFPVTMGTGKLLFYQWQHAGIYNITLTITNTYNETDTKNRSLTIQANNPPTATFTHTPAQPHVNDQITFDASSSHDTDGEIVSYAWDWDNNGAFDDPVYTATEYHLWTTPGTYPVTLKVTDDNGGINTTTQTIIITEPSQPSTNRPPLADFSYIPQDPTDLDLISFRDLSTDPDGWVVDWLWNFGDGATSTNQHPGHHYTTNGIYTIRLTVTDDMDATHTITQDITVLNVPPTASFTTLPAIPHTVNQTITLNSTSTDPDGTIINWTWNLEENITAYGEKITHTYTHDGLVNVTLTVIDDDGDTDTTTLPLTIQKKDDQDNTPGFGFIILLTATTLVLYIRKKQYI